MKLLTIIILLCNYSLKYQNFSLSIVNGEMKWENMKYIKKQKEFMHYDVLVKRDN